MADPLRVRMHYGHPDFFDAAWTLPRGGISKGSRTINLSEDIFAGFNHTLRGGRVAHFDVVQAIDSPQQFKRKHSRRTRIR